MRIAGRMVSVDLGNGVGNGRLAATLSAHPLDQKERGHDEIDTFLIVRAGGGSERPATTPRDS